MTKYILWIYIVLILIIDRLSKEYAGASLWTEHISIIGDFLTLKLAYNSWVAFSLPLTGQLQVIATILMIIGIEVYAFSFDPTRFTTLTKFGYASLLTWALSNAYDRINMGQVVDFVSLKYFAIFNVADIFITIWAILLILSHIRHERATRK